MPGRNGPVDEWDDADELASRVGFSSELNKHTAGRVLLLVQEVRRASVYLTEKMIGVIGEQVILRVPLVKMQAIEQEMRDARLLEQVQIEVVVSPSEKPSSPMGLRDGVQKLLF